MVEQPTPGSKSRSADREAVSKLAYDLADKVARAGAASLATTRPYRDDGRQPWRARKSSDQRCAADLPGSSTKKAWPPVGATCRVQSRWRSLARSANSRQLAT